VQKQTLPSWRGRGGRSFDPGAAESREEPPQEKTALLVPLQKALELFGWPDGITAVLPFLYISVIVET
jgi:hypothetical protein